MSSPTSAPTRGSTATRASCSTSQGSRSFCSGIPKMDRHVTQHRSESHQISRGLGAALKFGVFVTVMLAGETACSPSSAITEAAPPDFGDSVREEKFRVGTVKTVALQPTRRKSWSTSTPIGQSS